MTLGVLIALIVLVVLIGVVLLVARPRMGGRPGRRRPSRLRSDEDLPTEAVRGERLSREERVLVREGEAIRDHVEAELRASGALGPRRIVADPSTSGDALAWQVEQEQRERYPASFGAAGRDAAVPPRTSLSARDELARQIEYDRAERDGVASRDGASRDGVARPMSNGLQPELLPVSDPLELQLQEIAVESRGPAGWRGRRRRR